MCIDTPVASDYKAAACQTLHSADRRSLGEDQCAHSTTLCRLCPARLFSRSDDTYLELGKSGTVVPMLPRSLHLSAYREQQIILRQHLHHTQCRDQAQSLSACLPCYWPRGTMVHHGCMQLAMCKPSNPVIFECEVQDLSADIVACLLGACFLRSQKAAIASGLPLIAAQSELLAACSCCGESRERT